jgi:hypothetical protein
MIDTREYRIYLADRHLRVCWKEIWRILKAETIDEAQISQEWFLRLLNRALRQYRERNALTGGEEFINDHRT